jgi:hypothetical protein
MVLCVAVRSPPPPHVSSTPLIQFLAPEVPITEFNCHVDPQQTSIKQNPTAGATLFTATYKGIQLEFEAHDIYVYVRLANGSVYRNDWAVLQIPPLVPQPTDNFLATPIHNFDVSAYYNITWATPQELRASQILRNRFNQIMMRDTIFYFGIERSNIQIGDSPVKFSVQLTSILPHAQHKPYHNFVFFHIKFIQMSTCPTLPPRLTSMPSSCSVPILHVQAGLRHTAPNSGGPQPGDVRAKLQM